MDVPTMISFLDLPTELRQRILSLTLPDMNHIGKLLPQNVLSLLRVSQRLRLDVGHILDTWSPIHYIAYPSDVQDLKVQATIVNRRSCRPKLERVCLDLFHESEAQRIQWTCFCRGAAYFSHPELIAGWAEAVSHMPMWLSEIHLDVTPAPADKRCQHDIVINPFIHDKRAQNFLGCHIRDIGALIRSINMHYEGRIPIRLTGKLSRRSEFFVSRLRSESGVTLDFVGTWIAAEEARFAKISTAVERIAPYLKVVQAEQWEREYPLGKLREVTWSKSTVWTYAKVVASGEEEAAFQDLRMLADFMVDINVDVLRMGPTGSVRRALQHRMAQDMTLTTISEGEGEERHILVRKDKVVI